MTIDMQDDHLVTISQLEAFTSATHGVNFIGKTRKEKYVWTEKILHRFFYTSCRKRDKTTIRTYIMKITGYGDAQVTRLIRKNKETKHVIPSSRETCSSFPTKYNTDDVALLAKTDELHRRLSGPATKKIFEREYALFHNESFIRLKDISVAHIYRLRCRRQYLTETTTFSKTNPTGIPIGERRKPSPEGKPGHLRVDSVHQGDRDKEKGVYHINLVDEVTQWELVGCVEGISERFLTPLLEDLLAQFPFTIIEFHSDNGSEYINYTVAKLLNKLSIAQTKSRPRRCNDNALAEGKNGAIIRKHMGHIHIARCHAKKINDFYQRHFNTYINYHRPCGYATTILNATGKETKNYDLYETPYEHLKRIPLVETYLREGLTFKELDIIAYEKSDNECATLMKEAKESLFKTFRF
jgi:hypothetical protein